MLDSECECKIEERGPRELRHFKNAHPSLGTGNMFYVFQFFFSLRKTFLQLEIYICRYIFKINPQKFLKNKFFVVLISRKLF